MRNDTSRAYSYINHKHFYRDQTTVSIDDPIIIFVINQKNNTEIDEEKYQRIKNAQALIIKFALEILSEKQREIFYSVVCNSHMDGRSGIIAYSIKENKSEFTCYNSFKIAIKRIKYLMSLIGYDELILKYINDDHERPQNVQQNKKRN